MPAGLFHDFHQSWSIRNKDMLNADRLPEVMHALVEQKAGPKEADVLTVDMLLPNTRRAMSGGTAMLEEPKTRFKRVSTGEHYARRANRIVIKQSLGRTVAAFEIVSPENKDSSRAFQKFIENSIRFLDAGVHLLIVDLFPPTNRDPQGMHQAIWQELEQSDDDFELPDGEDRTVSSYRAEETVKAFVEPMKVGSIIPDMPLYLFDNFYVSVPLEAAYQETWSVFPKTYQQMVLTGNVSAASD